MTVDQTEELRRERHRLEVQARAWSPALVEWLRGLPRPCSGAICVDVGCGPIGGLPELREWAGPSAKLVGTDLNGLLLPTDGFVDAETMVDDVRVTSLPAEGFDVVHTRFLLSSAGSAPSITDALVRLVRPGGLLLVEEPFDLEHRAHPPAPALSQFMAWTREAMVALGGEPDVGRRLPALLRHHGLEPRLRSTSLTLRSGDPYAPHPLMMADAIGPRLSATVSEGVRVATRQRAEHELADPYRWSLSFPLVQAWAIKPDS